MWDVSLEDIERQEKIVAEKYKEYIEAKEKYERLVYRYNPNWCGLSHHFTCDCGGMGGDR